MGQSHREVHPLGCLVCLTGGMCLDPKRGASAQLHVECLLSWDLDGEGLSCWILGAAIGVPCTALDGGWMFSLLRPKS